MVLIYLCSPQLECLWPRLIFGDTFSAKTTESSASAETLTRVSNRIIQYQNEFGIHIETFNQSKLMHAQYCNDVASMNKYKVNVRGKNIVFKKIVNQLYWTPQKIKLDGRREHALHSGFGTIPAHVR